MKNILKKVIYSGLLISLILPLTACAEEKAGVMVTVYNHTDKGANANVEGVGGDAPPYGGGGAYMCCISIPAKWHPGLKVNIDWSTEGKTIDDWGPTHKVELEIPEYTNERGSFQIHVLPKGEINIFVSPYAVDHPNHPIYEIGLRTNKLREEYDKAQALLEAQQTEKNSNSSEETQ